MNEFYGISFQKTETSSRNNFLDFSRWLIRLVSINFTRVVLNAKFYIYSDLSHWLTSLNLLNDFLFYFFSRLRFWEIVNWKTFVEFLPSSMHTVIQQTDTALHIRHRIHIPIRCGSSSSRRAQSLTIWIFTFGPVYRDKVLYCSPSTLTFSFSMYLLLFLFFL